MEELKNCAAAKRTLLSSKANLQSKANQLEVLAKMSEDLVYKFKREEGIKGELIKDIEKSEHVDLIGLFDDVADEMQSYIYRIEKSLNMALDYID